MENHYFNIDVAKLLGINCAVILQHIYYWVKENEKANRNLKDEKYWTYNPIKVFHEQLPYLEQRQIRYALDKLKENGFILVANYHEKCDRTLWYSVTDKALNYLEKQAKVTQEDVKEESNVQNCQNEVTNLSIRNIQNCQMEMTKLSNHTNKIQQYNTTNNIEKEIYKEKESPGTEIFNFWNSQKLLKFTELNDNLETVIATVLKSFTLEQVKVCISRYAEVHNSNYFFSHAWTLKTFLTKDNAMQAFLDNGEKWLNYQHWKEHNASKEKKDSFIKSNYSSEFISSLISDLDNVQV